MSTETAGPFEDLREHEAALKEIGASNDPDAHVARVVLSLMHGEEPDPSDMSKLTETRTSGNLGSALTGPPVGVSTDVPPERQKELAARMLRRVRQREE